jgi:hypothetical protein
MEDIKQEQEMVDYLIECPASWIWELGPTTRSFPVPTLFREGLSTTVTSLSLLSLSSASWNSNFVPATDAFLFDTSTLADHPVANKKASHNDWPR